MSWVVMSVLFCSISCCCFVESLGHCTGVFLVWFCRSDSVSDPHTWDDVSFTGDVCASTSFLRLMLLVDLLCISIKWVSWCCCQTILRFGRSLVVSGLSIAVPEWRRVIFSLNLGLQSRYFHSSHFDWLFLVPEFVFPVFCATVHSSIYLWSGLSCHMSQRVDKQFLTVFQLCHCFCSCCCYYFCLFCCLG